MNVEEISKIIEVFAKSGLQEFSYEEGDVKLSLQGKQNAPAVSGRSRGDDSGSGSGSEPRLPPRRRKRLRRQRRRKG